MKKESVFAQEMTIESIGYHIAIAMALRDSDIKEPYDLLKKAEEYFPQCVQAATDLKNSQKKKPFHIPDGMV